MVDWLKQISTPATTTVDIFAGDVLNWVIQYHDDVDLAAGDPNGVVHILTETVFNSGRLKWYDSNKSHLIAITFPDYTEDKTITFPSTLPSTDDLVTRTAVQTLVNKTIDSSINAISNIGDSAITSHTSTKITITAKGQLNSSITYTDQTNTFGDFDQVFRSGKLDLRNPANTFNYSFVGAAIAAARNITLPLLTADDTLVTEAFAQSLTNKTIAAGSNTLTGIVDANISAHTSTKITITAKGQLNNAIVYNDQANTFAADVTMGDTRNIVLNTGTGTKIGTAIGQKLGFYNATPIAQGASIADISTSATGTQISVAVNAIISRLEALGLIATI